MKHLGDITKISGYDVPIVDMLSGCEKEDELEYDGDGECPGWQEIDY